ncbi:MAG: motility associated factor glycosyltransferase family protein [Lachnospiraceae bacterium]|nr:motility associated factor glycosyltransferase family protein [Lachnospiraceae bacterium]
MSFYEENLKVLTERFPELAGHDKDIREEITVQSETVADKDVLLAQTEEKLYQLDSLYDSEPVLDLWRSKMPELKIYAKILLFGFGNGCMIRKLLSTIDRTNRVIVYEPDFTVLSFVMEQQDITDILGDERVTLLVRSAFEGPISTKYNDILTFTDIESFQYYVYPNYNYLFLTEYLEYMQGVEDTCNSINSTQEVIGRFNEAYFLNTFANLNCFLTSRSLEDLHAKLPKDAPAIIVASGPSLDKNVAELAAAKGHAFIIAVDSALRTVLKAGITPDLCISIDPKKLTKHFSDDRANDIPMVCRITSNREVLVNHRAIKFFVNDLNHHIQHFFSRHNILFPVLASGGSVANDAFSVAQMLGFKTIIMIGQDLAYTDNRTHSAASVRGEWNIDASTLDQVMTEDIYGNPIAASNEFTLYRLWIEEQINMYPDMTVIDATEGGAKIHGSKIMTLKEAIGEHCRNTYPFSQILEDTKRFLPPETAKELASYILDIPSALEICNKKAAEGMRTYEQMLTMIYADKYRSSGFKKLFAKASEIGTFLEKEPVMEYVMNDMQKETTELLKGVYDSKDDERSELIAACNMGKDYLESMKASIERVSANISEQIKQVKVEG